MELCPDLGLDQNKPCRASSMCAFILKNMNLMTVSGQIARPVPALVCKLLAVICSQERQSCERCFLCRRCCRCVVIFILSVVFFVVGDCAICSSVRWQYLKSEVIVKLETSNLSQWMELRPVNQASSLILKVLPSYSSTFQWPSRSGFPHIFANGEERISEVKRQNLVPALSRTHVCLCLFFKGRQGFKLFYPQINLRTLRDFWSYVPSSSSSLETVNLFFVFCSFACTAQRSIFPSEVRTAVYCPQRDKSLVYCTCFNPS